MIPIIKAILTHIVCIVVLLPCVLIFNENGSFLPNIIGLFYIGMLFVVFRGKVAKKAYKALIKANHILGL